MRACSGLKWSDLTNLLQSMEIEAQRLPEMPKKHTLVRYRLLILLGSSWGLRIGDLLSLTWEQVKGEVIYIREQKTKNTSKQKKVRAIAIDPYIRGEIKKAETSTKLIFDNGHGRPISTQAVNEKLKIIFGKYGVKVQNASSHTLRKTFGKKVYDDAKDKEAALVLLSDIFNHSSTAITRRYIGITAEVVKDVYLSMWSQTKIA